jgi:hypothetical protein
MMKYIDDSGIAYSHWYIGIASDPKSRLFLEHSVSEKVGHWVYTNAGSENIARTVEKQIIENHKTQGDTGGGDNTTTFVYAYVVTNLTNQ